MTNRSPVVVVVDEKNETTDLGVLAKVLDVVGAKETPTNFNSVAVNNSTVHFGTKAYIDHVTIKQIMNGPPRTTDKEELDTRTCCRRSTGTVQDHDADVYNKWICCNGWSRPSDKCVWCIIVCAILVVTGVSVAVTGIGGPPGGNTYNEDNHHNVPIKTDIDSVLLTPTTLRFISRREWLAQPPSGPLDPMEMPILYVIITHTATENCTDQATCVFDVRYTQTFHMESRRWFDIGYNFLVGGDGAVYEGRGWDKVGAHTKGYNNRSIGIAMIGTFNDYLPPERQLAAAKLLISMGLSIGKLSKQYKLFGHRQLIPSLSPGNALFAEIQTWPHFARDFNNTPK